MTAEEFIKNKYGDQTGLFDYRDLKEMMIEFAKYHVEKALETLYYTDIDDITSFSGNIYTGEGDDILDLNKIKNIYPLTNIK